MRGSLKVTAVPRLGAAALLTVLCAFALAAPAPAAAAAEAEGNEITPGKGVGPITLGMSLQELVRLWGLPQEKARDQDGIDRYDYGEARGVLVFLKEDRVAQVIVLTPTWSAPSGAKVGMPWPEVRAFLGQPDEMLKGQTPDESRYWYKRRGIVFILKGRRVAAIVVVPAESESASQGFLDDLLGKGKARGGGGK